MRIDMNITNDAIMLTIDSRASERRATEPDTKNAANFKQKTTNPPITATDAD
jgi:hypothetical protein